MFLAPCSVNRINETYVAMICSFPSDTSPGRGIIIIRTRETYDPQTRLRPIPPLLPQEGSQDGKTPQPRHIPHPRRGREARAGGAVLQTPVRTPRDLRTGRSKPRGDNET